MLRLQLKTLAGRIDWANVAVDAHGEDALELHGYKTVYQTPFLLRGYETKTFIGKNCYY